MALAVHRSMATALGASLLAHLSMLGVGGQWWAPAPVVLDFPIEANLIEPALQPAPSLPPSAKPRTPPAVTHTEPSRRAAPVTPARAPTASVAEAAAAVPATVMDTPASIPDAVTTLPAEAVKQVETVSSPPGRKALRHLPAGLKVNYSVLMGENGFVAGRATYIWHSRSGKYSLVSTVEATGLASLFINGRIVQVSQGDVDDGGLRPEQYWLQRGERRQDVAKFNWTLGQLVLGGDRGGIALTDQAQDLLSFPFHLAMTASEGEDRFTLAVTNGRKMRGYEFRVLGRETIELNDRQVETLHIQGSHEGEGSLDVWLDMEKHGLPMKIQTLDQKGKVMMLRLEGRESIGADSGG